MRASGDVRGSGGLPIGCGSCPQVRRYVPGRATGVPNASTRCTRVPGGSTTVTYATGSRGAPGAAACVRQPGIAGSSPPFNGANPGAANVNATSTAAPELVTRGDSPGPATSGRAASAQHTTTTATRRAF